MRLSTTYSVVIFGSGIFLGTLVGATVVYVWKKSKLLNSLTNNVWPLTLNQSSHSNLVQKSVVISSVADFDSCLFNFVSDIEQVKLIGIDCEWTTKEDKQCPVALLQLSTISGLCLLIRLCLYKDSLPSPILEALSNPSIVKVGVGPIGDAKKLFIDHGIIVKSCVDLRALATRDRTAEAYGLKSLAKKYLNIHLNKSKSIQCSNWEASNLTSEQIQYAAMDAAVAVHIFSKIVLNKMCSSPGGIQSLTLKSMNHSMWNVAHSYCQGLKDIKFKQFSQQNKKSKSKQPNVNELRTKNLKWYSSRKHPLYDNCKLQAPDGQLLSTCDRKKATWYLEKKLADEICKEPLTVRLKFEPAGRPMSHNDYYLNDKENVCVVCGGNDSIVRKNVVPHEYRRHFPLVLKDHISHDILPVCVACHQLAGHYDCILRQKIADQYDAPLGSKQTVQLLEDPERRSVRSAGRALSAARNKIPEPRKSELESVVTSFFQEEICDEVIEKACTLETRFKNEAYIPHGEKVISTILSEHNLKGLIDFERRWRQHFLDTMQPKFLPDLWSVEHNHDRVQRG
uniref:Exonuclease 3'-5' domain-containing protein 2 n=1 Tax=Phallusia mammillata TaxID=59560 RepID=A0A6F9DBP0_9ASCI|nr:exonuclease 3'-5' domain-containing protein 2-like [Phallusia mammillata]